VSNTAAQLPDRFHFLSRGDLFLHRLQGELRLLPFSDVARNFGKANYFLFVVVIDRVDDNRCPKLCAVLSDAQALGLITP
jgi:hypothetical protein